MNPPARVIHAQRRRKVLILAAVILSVGLLLWGATLAAIGFSFLCWMVFLFGTLRPNSSLFGSVISQLPEPSSHVAITIDDGPDPHTTPALLEVLQRHRAIATFFLIGERAGRHPELVRAIAEAGHAIGNHSHTHPSGRYWCLGPQGMWREINGCQDLLGSLLPCRPALYRSPVGHTNPFVNPILETLGLRRVGWSARGYDAVSRDVGAIMDRIRPDLKPGAIVLLHEATPVATEVLERLLQELESNGLTTGNLP